MSIYVTTRDWVDRCWAGANYKLPLLPAVLPLLFAIWIGSAVVLAAAWAWLVLWSTFVLWRWALQMRDARTGRSAFGVRNRKSKKIKNG